MPHRTCHHGHRAGLRRLLSHAMGRHGHHRHHGGEPHDSEALTRGRKFSARDLQLMFLSLLAEQPRHGYELIKEVEQRSKGYYTPSPGVVYPALTYLEETGLVEVEAAGNRKLYRVSAAGQSQLAAEKHQAELMLASLAYMGKKMETMRRAMAGESAEGDESGWLPEYLAARHGLKRLLVLKAEADADEQRRIAAILQRAIREIEQPGVSDA
ncbi:MULTISPECIES: PadR family transcriptional regulator [unclassified Paludibacterium]|uniref:PadR family transcriptional regulator n=1 Tax=unclassified Paludibacterium TaxID=2618429 RepID=UPI001C0566AA|nr:PadR family transcriptional regulator [Paludibacterium sp. B53371]BEV72698.1 hypothetical protein THUN1379_21800 [Paludibacterium sp. THUN1379]